MIAVQEAYRAGLLTRSTLSTNIVAGIIVGVVSLPLSMAFAIASGVSPNQGIATAILAGLIVTLIGGSRVQIAGPTGAFVVVLLSILQEHGFAGLQAATILAGVILVAMGFLQMGAVIRFIPAPVIAGFTAGIGVVIWVGQWPDFFGIAPAESDRIYQKVPEMIAELPHLHLATTLLACLGLLVTIFSARIPRLQRIPSPLVAMVAVTIVQALVGFEGVATIDSQFGGISAAMPSFSMPSFSLDASVDLLGASFTIAMLCAIESLLSAVVADGMIGSRHNSNQELIGQGVANIVAPLFGGIAATGAIARTATSIRNGGRTPIAGISSAITLVLIMMIFAPLAGAVPLSALAAILFVVAWNMSDVRHFVRMARRAPAADVVILIVTFALTIATDLVIAVNVGVLLATLNFLRRMSQVVEVRATPATSDGVVSDEVAVFTIEGPFFFAAVDSFARALAHSHTEPGVLIVRLGHVPFMDITGIQALETMIATMRSNDVAVILCEANERVATRLRRAEVDALEGVRLVEDFDAAWTQANAMIAEDPSQRAGAARVADSALVP